MSRKSEHISVSELTDYEYKYYKDLKRGYFKVKISNSTYRCPFCQDNYKQDYSLRDLLQHASRFARDSQSRGVKEKAWHTALQLYIDKHLDVNRTLEPVAKTECPKRHKPDQNRTLEPAAKTECPKRYKPDQDQLFVWPWKGIVANISTELKDGRYVGESGTKLREELTQEGFHPLRVNPLWNRLGHSGCAIVEFRNDWEGFRDAMNFERSFEMKHCGKMDYHHSRYRGDRLYGWVARSDDYHSESIIGKELRRTGDLKTISEKESEEKKMTSKLVTCLANTLVTKNEQLKQVQSEYASLNKLMCEEEEMMKSFNDELKMILQSNRDHFEKIFMDHEEVRLRLEAQKKELENQEKDLQKRQAQNKNEMQKLYLEKKTNEMATVEQKKADEKVMRLAEEQKKEKEELHEKIHELQRKINAKQTLELEIEQLRGALKVMKHMGDDEDVEAKKKIDVIKSDLQDKEEELEALEELNQALIVKERKTNDELQDARKELINGIRKLGGSTRAFIGVKNMGELDNKPFANAIKRKFSDYELKVAELCSQWEAYLRDPSWHPFKILMDKEGNAEEIIDEEDGKLKTLRDEFGDEVFGAVATALMEMNEYNPSGRYTLPELWNFKEGRKASLKEGISHLLKLWKSLKRRKT